MSNVFMMVMVMMITVIISIITIIIIIIIMFISSSGNPFTIKKIADIVYAILYVT